MRFFYTLSIKLYYYLIIIASLLGNQKAKLWIKGRKDFYSKKINEITSKDLVWIHAASLGEFEQGRPLLERIKQAFPEKKILLSFFSPSGYEVRKNYELADYIIYLPIDTQRNAKRFVSTLKPSVAIFVKYEFWYNFLHELEKNSIPTFIISAIFRNKQMFFKPYGNWFRKQLRVFKHFFVQNEESRRLLESIGFTNTTIAGDTRFDRVFESRKLVKPYPLVEKFIEGFKVIVGGSTWEPDEEILAEYSKKQNDVKLIIAPHLVDDQHIDQTLSRFDRKAILFSELNESNCNEFNVLIINNIGHLSNLYQYGTIAHIGGGFGKGIHNTLEAATYKLPVTFGPKYQKFQEAKDLISKGAAHSINNYKEFKAICNNLLFNKDEYSKASKSAEDYVNTSIGATDKIYTEIRKFLA